MGPRLEIDDEWVTLVNPKRDIGRTDIHGIGAGDVIHAPVFGEIAADAAMRLRDAVLVAHHLRFERRFLTAEYGRCGIRLPELPGLCTLDLAYRLLPDAPSRKLGHCCEQAGILHQDQHTALGDARATAALLARFIGQAKHHRLSTLEELGCEPLEWPTEPWLTELTPTGKRLERDQATRRRGEERSYLARLVEGMPGDEARSGRDAEYLALVDRVLQDRRVTMEEAQLLSDTAAAWGMTRSDLLEAHRAYLASLASEALVDRRVTDAERRDLEQVCDLLGLHRADVLLSDSPASHAAEGKVTARLDPATSLRGKSVCFTGEMLGALRGERITREIAEKLATEAGLEVRSAVTKKLDLLVVADPDTQSLKAKKARQYNISIMAERAFWRALGVPIATLVAALLVGCATTLHRVSALPPA